MSQYFSYFTIYLVIHGAILLLWLLPDIALWIVGLVMLDKVPDSCKEDQSTYPVYAMAMAYSVLRGIGVWIQLCGGGGAVKNGNS